MPIFLCFLMKNLKISDFSLLLENAPHGLIDSKICQTFSNYLFCMWDTFCGQEHLRFDPKKSLSVKKCPKWL